MEFQKIEFYKDSLGKYQSQDKRIATVTSLFQSGLVHADKAREAIRKLSAGEDIREIETVKLAVQPLDASGTDGKETAEYFEREKVAGQIALAEAQGVAPRRKPTL